MTSEPESKPGRRPPTIELKATEVDNPAPAPDPASSDHTSPGQASPEQDEGTSRAAGSFAAKLKPHVASAGLGAAAMAAIIGAIWLAGLLPQQAAVPHEPAANSAPSAAPDGAAVSIPAPPPGSEETAKRLDAIERAVAAQQPEPALGNRLAAAEAQIKSLGDEIAALARRLDDIAATSQGAAKQAETAVAAARAAGNAARNGVQRGDLETLAGRIAALDEAVKTLSDSTSRAAESAHDRAARLTIAAETLRAAVERGAPFQAELAAVTALGADGAATAPLEPFAASGVPSAASLGRELAALTPALDHASGAAAGESTFLGRLKANAQKLVRVTPVDAPVGQDASALVARLAADAARADIDAGLADIAALPEAEQSLAADWVKAAQARAAAIAASRKIAADALAALDRSAAQ